MNEWDSFATLVASKSDGQCAVGKFMDSLPDEGRRAVIAAFENGASIDMVRSALRKIRPGEGMPASETWRRHRNGVCACRRGA